MNTLLVEIPTYQRPRILGRCLAALLAQTYQDFDVLITNDNPREHVDSDPVTAVWLKYHKERRKVWTEDGLGIGQIYSHNLAIWQSPWRNYEFVLRLDDDVLLNNYAIERMMRFMDQNENTAAVAGLWFDTEHYEDWYSCRDNPTTEQWEKDLELQGKLVNGVVSNWHQRLYHHSRQETDGSFGSPMRVEHLYGPWLYRSEIMRRVGGFPEIYSKGVHHGFETESSYRLHMAGYELYVLPYVTADHLRAPGGIRSKGTEVEHKQRLVDDPLRNSRLQNMPGAYKERVKVGLWGQHTCFVGGGAKMYFDVLKALSKSPYIDVWPVGYTMDLNYVNARFGIELDEYGPPPDKLDVLIQFGDDIEWFDAMRETSMVPEARSKALFVYYPFGAKSPRVNDFQTIITLSDYVVKRIADVWGWKSERIYPVTQPVEVKKGRKPKKENMILVVGRIDQWKGTLWLMETFAELDLIDWDLYVVGATEGSIQTAYIDQVRDYANRRRNIYIDTDVSYEDLCRYYDKAKVVMLAKGMLAEPDHLEEAEHYGLVPIEAMQRGCIPLVYDLGGHQETTPKTWRWKTKEELKEKLMSLVDNWEKRPVMPDISRFTDMEVFAQEWERVVLQTNAQVKKLEAAAYLSVTSRKPVMLVLNDSPRKKTGFAVVGNQIVPGFVDAGFDVYWYAILDDVDQSQGEFTFNLHRMDSDDLQGEHGLAAYIRRLNPDIIWAHYDPGNLYKYLVLEKFGVRMFKNKNDVPIPIVALFPFEGSPAIESDGMMAQYVRQTGGKAFTYSPGCAKEFNRQFPDAEVEGEYLGLDHADFRPYAEDDRRMLRQLVGLDEKFICGAFGVNKRTKQYNILVYAAQLLVEWGEDKDVLFYLHSELDRPILQGYPLTWMFKCHGVEHMFMGKPDTWRRRNENWSGAEFVSNTLEEARRLTMPPDPRQRGYLFGNYDIVSRYNCMDLGIDTSSVEGMGLPICEMMRCGIPTISVNDGMIRSEVHAKGAYMLDPIYPTPDTWHTGVQLCLVSPEDVAKAIVKFKHDPDLRKEYAERGRKAMEKYKWEIIRETMVKACKEALNLV